MEKRIYIQVALLTGRTYLGYVHSEFSPNYDEDISFVLHKTHFFFNKRVQNGENNLELICIDETPEGLLADMEIMWQAVATVQYLRDDSPVAKQIGGHGKERGGSAGKSTKGNLVVFSKKKE